ncbi:MAG: protein jag [Oscillospiraceae bacterium]|nr:protein jag [Oscillospiraceae bacterium]
MINYLEKTGKTEDEAVSAALLELGLDRDDVSVEILERAKSGFLGIGSSPARVRVSWESEDSPAAATPVPDAEPETPAVSVAAAAPAAAVDESEEYATVRSFLSGLLEHMGVEAEIQIRPRENGGISVDLSGPGMGAVIGRRGETLDAIQHLTNYAVNHGNDRHLRVSVDAENYRAKREESLTKLAEKMAEKAIKYKRSMALEPMNSYERHVIHTALQNYEGVTTASTGTEPNRRVVVSYVRTETEPRKPQTREWA